MPPPPLRAPAVAHLAVDENAAIFVETPNFRGPATVWVHPACRDGAPELAGVALAGLDQ